LDELPRYSIIAGYFQYFKPEGSLIDVGCGEGILQEKLGPYSYSKYVGVDISEAAINQAVLRNDEKTAFVCNNALNYISTERFDAIVFNEILYYCDEPLEVVEKYKQYLKADGIIITSLYLSSDRAASIWKRLKANYSSLDEVKAANKLKTWVFNVFVDPNAIAQQQRALH
jgi:2-polyprenyl-3-methyl-5-hydroxy-6-metoxy-1,4-benzoquinol methylase